MTSTVASTQGAEGDIENALPFSKLQLTLRLSKSDYVLGEPIAAYARLANPHPTPVRAHHCWGWFRRGGTRWEGGEVWLYIELTRGGKTLDINQPYGRPHGTPPARHALIPAGAVLRAKQLIVYGNPRVDRFLAPGTVEMRIKLRGIGRPPEAVASNPVQITIRAPDGGDADAYHWLRQRQLLPYLGYLLFLKGSWNDEERRSLKEFLVEYRDTVYAPYAQFSLGQMDYYAGRYDEANKAFHRVIMRRPRPPVAEDARYLMADIYRILLKPLEADHMLRLLIEYYPDTLAAEDAEDLRAHLRGVPLRGQPE